MNNVATEADSMMRQFPTPPPKDWYEGISLPISWMLLGGLEGKKVLDIGCNSGWVGYWARKLGAIVTCSDIFSTHVHPSLRFVRCSKDDLPFPDETFSVVATGNVLHHGSLDMSEVHRVLKKSGLFVSLQEPCIDNDKDELEYLNAHVANELQLGIDEHRPSLRKYIEAFSAFETLDIYEMNDQMFVPPKLQALHKITGDNYEGGIAIRAIK
jgi:SAM-dependent methyltransferase